MTPSLTELITRLKRLEEGARAVDFRYEKADCMCCDVIRRGKGKDITVAYFYEPEASAFVVETVSKLPMLLSIIETLDEATRFYAEERTWQMQCAASYGFGHKGQFRRKAAILTDQGMKARQARAKVDAMIGEGR